MSAIPLASAILSARGKQRRAVSRQIGKGKEADKAAQLSKQLLATAGRQCVWTAGRVRSQIFRTAAVAKYTGGTLLRCSSLKVWFL